MQEENIIILKQISSCFYLAFLVKRVLSISRLTQPRKNTTDKIIN